MATASNAPRTLVVAKATAPAAAPTRKPTATDSTVRSCSRTSSYSRIAAAPCRLRAKRRQARISSVTAMPSWVMLPVMTLVCGMPFIRSRTSTLCAPMALAATRPATMPCQSRAFWIVGPNSSMAAKIASSAASSASINGSAVRPVLRASPISAAVMAAARTNATMARSFPAMP